MVDGLGLHEWHQPTMVCCSLCEKAARVSTHPRWGGGNVFCVEHAREAIDKWLQEVEGRTAEVTPELRRAVEASNAAGHKVLDEELTHAMLLVKNGLDPVKALEESIRTLAEAEQEGAY